MSPDLPPEAERLALMDGLDELAARLGANPLLLWPVLRCTPQYFPDAWEPGLDGVAAMVRRIMHSVGLGALQLEVEPHDGPPSVEYESGIGSLQTRLTAHLPAASFLGLDGRVCRFGVSLSQLSDPEFAAGALAGEVARAYRSFHGLTSDDPTHEAQASDLTTVFLGLGVLRANVGDRFRSEGEAQGAMAVQRWEHHRLGALSPAAMCFLLAVQSVLRNLSRSERRDFAQDLERNQAARYTAALSWLDANDAELRDRIEVPSGLLATGLQPALQTLPAAQPIPRPRPAPADARPPNEGAPVFRVRRQGFELVVRAFWGLVAGLVLSPLTQSLWPLLVGPLMVVLFEKWLLPPLCTGCMRRLPGDVPTCGSCGGTIAGTLGTARDRHDAEERYWSELGGRPEQHTKDDDVGL